MERTVCANFAQEYPANDSEEKGPNSEGKKLTPDCNTVVPHTAWNQTGRKNDNA